jgi:amino acid permease
MRVLIPLSLLFLAVSAANPKPKAVLQKTQPRLTKANRDLQRRIDAKAKQYQAGILPPPTNVGSGATSSNEVFNLVKGIVGVGVLSLPAGIAAFGSAPSALVPALALIATIGLLSGYGFALIGKVCAYTGARSYREAWESSVGPSTAWIPAWSATLKTMLACLAYSMVLGDTFTVLLPVSNEARNVVLVGVTTFILLPLCWMKDLKSLAPFSLLGVMGMAVRA